MDLNPLCESEFIRLKPIEPDETIRDRLNKLLDDYECFKSPDIHARNRIGQESHGTGFAKERKGGCGAMSSSTSSTSSSSSSHHRRHTSNNPIAAPFHHYHHHKRGQMPPYRKNHIPGVPGPPKRPPTYERELQSTLNKLTRHNYVKLATAILDFKCDKNLDLLVASLLEKCYTQTCFLDLFICLLCDLHASSGDDVKTRIDNALAVFVTTFMGSDNLLSFRIRSTTKDYEGFCTDISNRNQIVGKHRTILALLERMLDKRYGNVYLRTMLGALDDSLQNEQSVNTDAYELLLDMMMDFVKADAGMAAQIRDHFETKGVRSDALPSNISTRARFKICDILGGAV